MGLYVYLVDQKAIKQQYPIRRWQIPAGKSYRLTADGRNYRFATGGVTPGAVIAARPGVVGAGGTSGIGLGAFERRPFFASSMTTLLFSRIVPVA